MGSFFSGYGISRKPKEPEYEQATLGIRVCDITPSLEITRSDLEGSAPTLKNLGYFLCHWLLEIIEKCEEKIVLGL